MQHTLHVEEDMFTYNDGYRLFPSFDDSNSPMDSPDVCCMKSFRDLPLDAVHANATAWYGKMKFVASATVILDRLSLLGRYTSA